MKIGEILQKDFCPKWLRLSATSRLRIGSIMMVGSVLWCVVAPWLSAHNKMTVFTEFDSYCLAAIALIYGAGNYLQYSKAHLIARIAALSVTVILFFASIFESSHAFFFWKVKIIQTSDLSEMTLYLKNIGTQNEERGPVRSDHGVLPKAIRPLGLAGDYGGETGQFLQSREFMGHTAAVIFGNKLQKWGVFEGNEELMDEYSRGCRHVQVGQGVYFFVGSAD